MVDGDKIEEEAQKVDGYEPDEHFMVTELEALKVISDPLRVQIMEIMLGGPLTVKQVAEKLGMSPTKLYYHFNLLEEHGFLRVVSTRVVSGIIEKLYHLRAYGFSIDRSLFSPTGTGESGLDMLLSTVMERVRLDIAKSIEAGLISTSKKEGEPKDLMLQRGITRMPRERAQEFFKRLQELLEEFDECDTKVEEDPVYGMMVAFYPTVLRVPKGVKKKKKE